MLKISFVSLIHLLRHSHKYFIAFHIMLRKTIFVSYSTLFVEYTHTIFSSLCVYGDANICTMCRIVLFFYFISLQQSLTPFTSVMFCEMEKVSFFLFCCYCRSLSLTLCSALFYVENMISFRG